MDLCINGRQASLCLCMDRSSATGDQALTLSHMESPEICSIRDLYQLHMLMQRPTIRKPQAALHDADCHQ